MIHNYGYQAVCGLHLARASFLTNTEDYDGAKFHIKMAENTIKRIEDMLK